MTFVLNLLSDTPGVITHAMLESKRVRLRYDWSHSIYRYVGHPGDEYTWPMDTVFQVTDTMPDHRYGPLLRLRFPHKSGGGHIDWWMPLAALEHVE